MKLLLFFVGCALTSFADDTRTHTIDKITCSNKRMRIVMLDGSEFKVRPADQMAVGAFWKSGDDLILYRNFNITTLSHYWFKHIPTNSHAYVRLKRSEIEKEGMRFHIDQIDPPNITIKRDDGQRVFMELKIRPHDIESQFDGWEVGTPVTFGSTWSLSRKKRSSTCFIVNLVTGDHCSADGLDMDQTLDDKMFP